MKIKLTIFLIIFSLNHLLASPKLIPAWVKKIHLIKSNHNPNCLNSDNFGNSYFLTEYDTLSFDKINLKSKKTQTSFAIFKFNSKGKLLWQFTLAEAAKYLNVRSWKLCQDGSVYIGGDYNGPITINAKSYDSLGYSYLLRINKYGQFSWLKTGAEFGQASIYLTENNGIGYCNTTFSVKNYKSKFGDTLVPLGFYKGICELDSNGNLKKRKLFHLSNFNSPNFTVTSNGRGKTYAILLLDKDTFYTTKKNLINQKGSKSSFYFMLLDKNLNPKWIKEWTHVSKYYNKVFGNNDFKVDDIGNMLMSTEYSDTITMDGKILIIDSSTNNNTTCLSKMDTLGNIKWIVQGNFSNGLDDYSLIDVIGNKLYTYYNNSSTSSKIMSIDTFNNRPNPAIITYNTLNGRVLAVDTAYQGQYIGINSLNGNERLLFTDVGVSFNINNISFTPNNNYNYVLVKLDTIGITNNIELNAKINYNTCLIYPNPSKALFNVKFCNSFTGQIVVINSMGQVIMQKNNLNATSTELNLEGQSSGLYHIILTEKLGQTAQYQILKQ